MLTRKRITLPVLSGDWKVDGPNVLKAISDYLLSLEQKGALAITEAEISGTVGTGNLDLNGNDLIIDADADTYLHETADDVARMVVAGSDHTIWNTTGLGIGVVPSAKFHVNGDVLIEEGSLRIGTGGTYSAGVIYSDANWGMIFRAKQASPVQAEFRWAKSDNTELMRLTTTGLGLGVTPSYMLHVGSGQIAAPDGSAAAPTYSFASSGNADTGIYLPASNEVAVAGAGAMLTTFKSDRLTFASGFHVTSATATGTTPALQSGTYTPTLSNTTNITSSTANADAKWFRVGNIVRVSCPVNVRPAGAGSCVLGVSLPIASNLAASTELSGVGVWSTTIVGSVTGDTTNDRATFIFTATVDPGVEAPTQIEFSYEVL